jgi:hypothetical protein
VRVEDPGEGRLAAGVDFFEEGKWPREEVSIGVSPFPSGEMPISLSCGHSAARLKPWIHGSCPVTVVVNEKEDGHFSAPHAG